MSRVGRNQVVAAALLATAVTLAACSSGGAEGAAARTASPQAVPVSVAKVMQKDVPILIRAIGNVEPLSTVTLRSQVEGQLAEVHFRRGAGGQPGRPFVHRRSASLRGGTAARPKPTWRATWRRRKTPRPKRSGGSGSVKQGFISQRRERSGADPRRRGGGDDQGRPRRGRKRQAAAPILLHPRADRRRIGQFLVHAGNVVKANDTELAVINQIRPVYVAFSVPEQQLPRDPQPAASGGSYRVQAAASGTQAGGRAASSASSTTRWTPRPARCC